MLTPALSCPLNLLCVQLLSIPLLSVHHPQTHTNTCRCLRPIILLLDSTPCPALTGLVDAATGTEKVPGGAALAATAGDDESDDEVVERVEKRQLLLAQTLVGELVLATKEVRGEAGGGRVWQKSVGLSLSNNSAHMCPEGVACISCINSPLVGVVAIGVVASAAHLRECALSYHAHTPLNTHVLVSLPPLL